MKPVQRPRFGVDEVFGRVGGRLRWDRDTDLALVRSELIAAESSCGLVDSLGDYCAPKDDLPPGTAKKNFLDLYSNHFVPERSAGRPLYNELRDATGAKCAFCTNRAGTLDHYFEKAVHPILAVTPLNLMPACSECNWCMRELKAKFNVYFDDPGRVEWLEARLLMDGSDASAYFMVADDLRMESNVARRLRATFHALQLGPRLTVQHAGDIIAKRKQMAFLSSVDLRRRHLKDEYESRAELRPGDAMSALLKAMISSEEFLCLDYRDSR